MTGTPTTTATEQPDQNRPNAIGGPGLLAVDGHELKLPRIPATDGTDGPGASKLLGPTSVMTLDPGFTNTVPCTSQITYIDGAAGILRYRGCPIEELTKPSTFLEAAYLLINGELPDREFFARMEQRISCRRLLHKDFRGFFTSFPSSGHPMVILQAEITGLATYYEGTLDPHDPYGHRLATALLPAKTPTMISYIARRAIGLPPFYPDPQCPYVEGLIRLIFGMSYQLYEIDLAVMRALDMLLILHTDYEQNCSTSTMRFADSADTDMYASVTVGVGVLSESLHGGTNKAAPRMLDTAQNSGMSTAEFVRKVKDKKDDMRLMGFGHRVYKSYDPRAAIVKKTAHDVLTRLGSDDGDHRLEVAMGLEETALYDEYLISYSLYPNAGFYAGLTYQAMDFPTGTFTPLFALGHLPGWIVQYHEMIVDPTKRIGRPRQVYDGSTKRHYVVMHRHEHDDGQYPATRTGVPSLNRATRI